MAINQFSIFAVALTAVAFFAACGDDITKINATESTGLSIAATYDSLPECTGMNAGTMAYAKDSAKVYYCTDSSWATLNGSDGANGAEGASCKADANEDSSGYYVICDGDTVGQVLNGVKGNDGTSSVDTVMVKDTIVLNNIDTVIISKKDTVLVIDTVLGLNGTSCTAEMLADSTGYKIICGTDSVGVVLNGTDGEDCSCCGSSSSSETSSSSKANWAYLNPAISYGEFTDARDNQVYKSVVIGTQTWMAENLNYSDSISSENLKGNNWCFDNDTANCTIYGRMYSWTGAMNVSNSYQSVILGDSINHQGACPDGWHIPRNSEWNTLANYAGGNNVAGGKLKSLSGWYNDGNGTDDYGFSAIPSGWQEKDKSFHGLKTDVDFWMASEGGASYGYHRFLLYSTSVVSSGSSTKYYYKNAAYSVRCLKDND